MIYAVLRAGVRLLARIVLGRRLRISGMEDVPRSGAVLVVGNHVGTVEPALTGAFIPRLDVYYMAKSELFRNPFLAWLFSNSHAFPVVRDSADRGALRRGSLDAPMSRCGSASRSSCPRRPPVEAASPIAKPLRP